MTFSSALSYIPEKTWNNSCADSTVLALEGYAVAYGANGLCNNYRVITGSRWPAAVASPAQYIPSPPGRTLQVYPRTTPATYRIFRSSLRAASTVMRWCFATLIRSRLVFPATLPIPQMPRWTLPPKLVRLARHGRYLRPHHAEVWTAGQCKHRSLQARRNRVWHADGTHCRSELKLDVGQPGGLHLYLLRRNRGEHRAAVSAGQLLWLRLPAGPLRCPEY